MKDAQYDEPLTVIAVPENVGRAQDLKGQLAIFLAAFDGSPELRVSSENLCLLDNFGRNDLSQIRMPLMRKAAKRLRSARAAADHSNFMSSSRA